MDVLHDKKIKTSQSQVKCPAFVIENLVCTYVAENKYNLARSLIDGCIVRKVFLAAFQAHITIIVSIVNIL